MMTSRASSRLWQLVDCLSYTNLSKTAVAMSTTASRAGLAGVTVTSKHLTKGDSLPPKTDDTPRLFNMKYSPNGARVRLVLEAKGIPHDIVNCDLVHKPKFLLERNPKGAVPVLEYKGHAVYESVIICELIDELFPERPMYPTDPISKAKDKLLINFFDNTLDKIVHIFGAQNIGFTCILESKQSKMSYLNLHRKVMRFGEDVNLDIAMQYQECIQRFEDELKSRGTPYLSGSEPGMVDYMCWPLFRYLDQVGNLLSKFPTFIDYLELMKQDDTAIAVHIPAEEDMRFWMGFFTNNTVYDF